MNAKDHNMTVIRHGHTAEEPAFTGNTKGFHLSGTHNPQIKTK